MARQQGHPPSGGGAVSEPIVVVGGGPNGLVTACYLAQAGRQVLVLEAAGTLGGGSRTDETIPGYRFNTHSAAHNIINVTSIPAELDLAADAQPRPPPSPRQPTAAHPRHTTPPPANSAPTARPTTDPPTSNWRAGRRPVEARPHGFAPVGTRRNLLTRDPMPSQRLNQQFHGWSVSEEGGSKG